MCEYVVLDYPYAWHCIPGERLMQWHVYKTSCSPSIRIRIFESSDLLSSGAVVLKVSVTHTVCVFYIATAWVAGGWCNY